MAEDSRFSIDETMSSILDVVSSFELFDALVEVARYLEAAYLSVSEYPEIANRLRMTAQTARTQHLMSASLMRSFKTFSSHVIDTLIPMILDAVKLQERSTIDTAFDEIKQMANKMSQKASETGQRYRDIRIQDADSMNEIASKKCQVFERVLEIKSEMGSQTHIVIENKRRAVKKLQETEKQVKNGPVLVSLFYQSEADEIHQLNEERAGKWNYIKQLCMEKASLGDATSLANAMTMLSDVDLQLTRLIQFWDRLIVLLDHVKNNTDSGKIYLTKIEDERFAARFTKSVKSAEEKWKMFGMLCQNYVEVCHDNRSTAGIYTLYKFLSDPINYYSEEDRLARMNTMFRMIQEEVKETVAIYYGDL